MFRSERRKMKSIMDAFDNVFDAANEANKPNQNDYIDAADGLYHCGVCKQPKQKRQEFLGRIAVVGIMCKCREEEVARQERERQKQKVELLKSDGFTDRTMEGCRFEVDDNPESAQSKACRNYVEHFQEFYSRGKGLLLTGSVGTGKTFLATCIANALMDKLHPVLMTSISRYIRGMEGEFGNRNEHIDYLNKFDLVVFDDLGIERNTPYMNELVYALIDGRIRTGKPMVITTNETMKTLRKTESIDISKTRIYDRILSACIPIEFNGENIRRQQAREDYLDLKGLLGI